MMEGDLTQTPNKENSAAATANAATSPVYAVYFTSPNSPICPNLFQSLKEATTFANSPEGKSYGARFKRFGTPREAHDFLAGGDCVRSVLDTSFSRQTIVNEPKSPYPSLRGIDMNKLKRVIEKGTQEGFEALVASNPRFLVNTSGDTAAIVQEGFRYNVLHVAARAGNAAVVRFVLKKCRDLDFLADLYGSSIEDVDQRRARVVDSLLNTPDKGSFDTPLHIACKFGHVDVVAALVELPECERERVNKAGEKPLEILCSRYSADDVTERRMEMRRCFERRFVALYRTDGHLALPKILEPSPFRPPPIFEENSSFIDFASPSHVPVQRRLSAYAELFDTKRADAFFRDWITKGRELKRNDPERGFEKVGRGLLPDDALWYEAWSFHMEPVNLCSEDSLALLELHFRKVSEGKHPFEDVKKRLNFDEDEDEEKEAMCNEDEDEVFVDAPSEPWDESLNELCGDFGGLRLNSPQEEPVEEEEEELPFVTPPSTPPPLGLHVEERLKEDSDLFAALERVPIALRLKFPLVSRFYSRMSSVPATLRAQWPAKDSPRRLKSPSRRFLE